MTYDLPRAKGSLNAPPFAALATDLALVIGIRVIMFDGDRQSNANTDEVTGLQEIIPALPELCTGTGPRC